MFFLYLEAFLLGIVLRNFNIKFLSPLFWLAVVLNTILLVVLKVKLGL